ncbi:MAG: rhamnan synthesis F family protein, partial [Anaerolineaceae bacterium]|nr:rhamnan synthesis F family protein [Anaerolineaceae bacterium]
SEVFDNFPDAQILIIENKGRDIAPFIEIYRSIKDLNYTFILKLHSKKSIHREDGDAWRNDILSKLIGSKGAVKTIKNFLIEKPSVGIIGPKKHVLDHRVYWGFNKETTLKLATAVGILCDDDPEFNFIAGSMFWAKPDALRLLDLLPVNTIDFEPEPTPPDGALAHGVERFVGLAVKESGYSIMEIDEFGVISKPDSGNLYPFAQPYPQ